MEKVQGSIDMLNSLQTTEKLAGMDKASKELMKNKEVLAVILKGVVKEYQNYSYAEIMDFIEGDSISDDTEVSVGRSSTRIVGDDKEYACLDEKTSTFDTKFRAINPELSKAGENLLIHIHFDVEMQKTYRPGYPIEKRGEYYLARELSAQLSVVTKETDYNSLEKCYSIWICRDDIPKEERFSISFYEFENTRNYGKVENIKENYDLLNLVVIRLGDSVYNGDEEDEGYDVLRFLNAIMYPHKGSRLKVVKEYIDFSQNSVLWKEADGMEGLGMSILQDGYRQGREEGIEQGIEQGEQLATERMNRLFQRLYEDGRAEDAMRSTTDPEFQKLLLREYKL